MRRGERKLPLTEMPPLSSARPTTSTYPLLRTRGHFLGGTGCTAAKRPHCSRQMQRDVRKHTGVFLHNLPTPQDGGGPTPVLRFKKVSVGSLQSHRTGRQCGGRTPGLHLVIICVQRQMAGERLNQNSTHSASD